MGNVRLTPSTGSRERLIPLNADLDLTAPQPASRLTLDGPDTPAARVSRRANAHMTSPERALDPRYQVRQPRGPYTVNGMTEARALELSGDRGQILHGQGSSFTAAHEHGDLANRFSHGVGIKTYAEISQRFGVPPLAAAYIGMLSSVPKEMFVDLNADPADIGFVDVPLVDLQNDRGQRFTVTGSVWLDGATFGSATVKF